MLFKSSYSRVLTLSVIRMSKSVEFPETESAIAKTRLPEAGVPMEKKSTSPVGFVAPSIGQEAVNP